LQTIQKRVLIAGEDALLIYAGSSIRSDGKILGAPITRECSKVPITKVVACHELFA
jgi:hypothetical protein